MQSFVIYSIGLFYILMVCYANLKEKCCITLDSALGASELADKTKHLVYVVCRNCDTIHRIG